MQRCCCAPPASRSATLPWRAGLPVPAISITASGKPLARHRESIGWRWGECQANANSVMNAEPVGTELARLPQGYMFRPAASANTKPRSNGLSKLQRAGQHHLPRIAQRHKETAHRRGVVRAVEQVFHVELKLDLLPVHLRVIAGEGISHGVGRELEVIGRVPGAFTHIVCTGPHP